MVGSEGGVGAAGHLLETKLFVPRPPRGLVARPRLSPRLDQGVQTKLTLLSAPAGFGKTTLLAEWLAAARHDEWSVAWLSIDPSDNQPGTFWTYLIAAVQRVEPSVGSTAVSLLHSPQPPRIDTILSTFLNELTAMSKDVVLVLDDFHLIETHEIQHGIAFVLDHLPPRVHVVIASRVDPPLPLPRLRARGELVEIRAAHLQFQSDELTTYLNEVMGLHVGAPDVEALEERTEGWIAAIQLAALSMQGRQDISSFIAGFAGDDRYILDYLVQEVLQYQPESVREFLLETSILDRLSASLCDAVTGRHDGKTMLQVLERGNLFLVPLDDRRSWYRYHQLFADVLRAHLIDHEADRVPDLHLLASQWYERHGEASEAIRHAVTASNFERVAELVERVARPTLRSSRPGQLIEWAQVIPDDLIRVRPILSIYYAFALLGVGQLESAETWLRSAEERLGGTLGAPSDASLARTVVADAAEVQSGPGIIALGWAYAALTVGDVPRTIELGRRALELMPESDYVWRAGAAVLLALTHWRSGDLEAAQHAHDEGIASLERSGDISLAISAAYDAADLRKARGRLSEARRVYERALRFAGEHSDATVFGTADLHLGLSDLHCERDEFESARWHLQRGEELAKHFALAQTHARACVLKARVLQAEGDLDGAVEFLEMAERLHVVGPVPEIRPIAALKVRLWIAQHRLTAATEWARTQDLSVEDDLDYPREFEHVTLARLLIARCEHERDRHAGGDALRLLARLLTEAESHGRMGSALEILICQARAHQLRGDFESALTVLGRALSLAEPEDYVRIFVAEGEPMRDLLHRAVAAGRSFPYARRLLSAFDVDTRSSAGPGKTLATEGPLTAREAEIMRLLAIGMTNQGIAEQLVISLPTVKWHIANVYGKLGVSHRTEAVARANELGLLESPVRH